MTQLYTTLTILCFLYFPMKALGQNCANIGFENGTLDGWQLSYGDVMTDQKTTVFGPETQGTNNKGHLITKITDGNDPLITSEAIPMVAPGSNYSIRIGNKATGAKYDRIKTSFLVTPDNTLFQYRFAIVLEDPDHFSYQQPALRIKIKTLTEGDISCGYYEVTAARGIPGFKEQPPLTYRNWTTSSLDLSRFLGQMITLENHH
ncbi:hypothetical protein CLV98_12215 [Dyadobacter jejuensis]|uniref:Carbohydrate binding protein n=1 Tax=Dyadobacter jejuensis TaxID=1082580 RepID=A0A316A822_9BACT|nr:hypothetical protein [Dyadobacter jejuensis]PWJ53589.1 hypothetical protein CLV98_12215 [Dyadobacter jejuensis]